MGSPLQLLCAIGSVMVYKFFFIGGEYLKDLQKTMHRYQASYEWEEIMMQVQCNIKQSFNLEPAWARYETQAKEE